MKEIQQLNNKLDPFLFNGLGLLLFFGMIVSMVVFSFLVAKSDKVNAKIAVSGTIAILMIVSMAFIDSEQNKIYEKLEELELAYIQSLDKTNSVKIGNIVSSTAVSKNLCPHVELKKEEKCTFVEFSSDNEISQIFIPLPKAAYSNLDDELTITYYDLTKEERALIDGFFEKQYIGSYSDLDLYPASWSLGVSITK